MITFLFDAFDLASSVYVAIERTPSHTCYLPSPWVCGLFPFICVCGGGATHQVLLGGSSGGVFDNPRRDGAAGDSRCRGGQGEGGPADARLLRALRYARQRAGVYFQRTGRRVIFVVFLLVVVWFCSFVVFFD